MQGSVKWIDGPIKQVRGKACQQAAILCLEQDQRELLIRGFSNRMNTAHMVVNLFSIARHHIYSALAMSLYLQCMRFQPLITVVELLTQDR